MSLYNPYKPKRERPILVFDIEGYRYSDLMVPYLLGVYDPLFEVSKWNPFIYRGENCIKEFLDKYITYSNRGKVFYAHYGSIFDFPLVLDELNKRPFNIYPIVKGTKIIKMTISDNDNHNWYFQDSSALLDFSLDKLSQAFIKNESERKLHPVQKSKDYDVKLYQYYLKHPNEVIQYLRNDCTSLYKILDEFKHQILNIGGDMGLTIASTSLKTFNHKYQQNPLYMCEKETNDIFRNAYYGGRTEIFRMYAPEKLGPYSYYDINSLYPTVMERNLFPVSSPQLIHNPRKEIIREEIGITNARIETPIDRPYIPLFPQKIQVGQSRKMMFVTGKFEGWWDNSLLQKAMDLGYKVEGLKSYTFKAEPIFKDYIHDFYKIKKESEKDTPMYIIAKLLMNSLYGKFGQHQISQSMIKDPNPDEEKYKIISTLDFENDWVIVEEEGKGKSYLPQISVHVTALAQLMLFESFEKVMEKDYHIFYCDTDSMITDYNNMRTSKELGDWKLEKKVLCGYFVLPKTYKIIAEDGKIDLRAKGYSRNLQSKISANAFEQAVFHENFAGFKVISDQKEMLRAKASFRRFHDFNHLDYMRKSIQHRYNKRKILKDLDTRAFDINEVVSI